MLSVTIICKNEEKNIEDCLKSVSWADEIIVVDSRSSDKTIEIAKRYTDRVFNREWEGYASQRSFALKEAKNEWIFPLDADERCTKELKEEILSIINNPNTSENGFWIPRKNFFLNHWLKHSGWYPGYQMRLFRKDKTSVADRLVHEGYEVEAKTGKLKSDILHYTVNSISDYMNKVNNYSTLQALEKSGRGKVKFSDLFLRPLAAYLQQYFLQGGFLDGIPGLMAVNFHVMTNMLTYMKIWEMQKKTSGKEKEL